MTNIKTHLEELLKLSDAATPGPWKLDEGNWNVESRHDSVFRAEICGIGWNNRKLVNEEKANPVHPYSDGEFIAASRSAVPALVKALQIALEALDACGFDGDPDKRLELVNATLKQIEAIMAGEK
jgi:hypothetical protein